MQENAPEMILPVMDAQQAQERPEKSEKAG